MCMLDTHNIHNSSISMLDTQRHRESSGYSSRQSDAREIEQDLCMSTPSSFETLRDCGPPPVCAYEIDLVYIHEICIYMYIYIKIEHQDALL